jgi:hypothetical protein
MPASQLQAVAARVAWARPGPGEQQEAGALLGPNIAALIAQFASSARQNPTATAFVLSPQAAGDATQELASILPQLSGARVPGPPDGGTPAAQRGSSTGPATGSVIPRGLAPDASLPFGGASAQSEQAAGSLAAAPVDTFGPAGGTQKARERGAPPVRGAATVTSAPTFPASRPAARVAMGTGGSSGAPSAAALFALAVVRLPVPLAGRVRLDLLRCKSALLTSRLERPG